MRDDLVNLVRESAAEPLDTPDFDAMAARGHRQRTATRVLGGSASALVLLVAGVMLWPSTPAGSPVIDDDGPGGATGGGLAELPVGWQLVQVGHAQFGVPGEWQVVDTTSTTAAHCQLYYTTPPMVLTGPAPQPISCPAPDVTNPGPGLRATTLTDSSDMAPPMDAAALDVNGWPVQRWTESRTTEANDETVVSQFEVYRVDALDLYVKIRTDSAPDLAGQIMATLSPVAGTAPSRTPSEGGGGQPYDPDARMRPDLLEINPSPAAPGETVELTYPEQSPRGLGFVLERQLPDGSWSHVYTLTSSPVASQREPAWWPANNRQGWELLAVGGPGPDRVVVPEAAEPGDYRICTANAGDEFCAPLRIEGGPGVPAVPTRAELQAPYEPLFDGLPTPQGDGVLVSTDSRIEGLGAFLAAGQPLPLDQPNAVQDAPADATFTVVLHDADTGETVAEVTPDTPPSASFDGPTAGPIGTRYVVEATLRNGDQTTTWTDAAVVTDLTVDVDIVLTGLARPGEAVEFVLANRGPAGVVHGLGFQLDRFVDGTWVQVENPTVNAMGFILGPASLSDPLTTSSLPGPGHYRLTAEMTLDQGAPDAPPDSQSVTLEFKATDRD